VSNNSSYNSGSNNSSFNRKVARQCMTSQRREQIADCRAVGTSDGGKHGEG
jgi:hypothetical protein